MTITKTPWTRPTEIARRSDRRIASAALLTLSAQLTFTGSAWGTPGGVVPVLGPFLLLAGLLQLVYVVGVLWLAWRFGTWLALRRAAAQGSVPALRDGRRQSLIAGALIVAFTFKRVLEVCLFIAALVAAKARWF
jgi:hypothetical protein